MKRKCFLDAQEHRSSEDNYGGRVNDDNVGKTLDINHGRSDYEGLGLGTKTTSDVSTW